MKRIDTDAVQAFETEHAAVVRKVAPECMVLLKNNGALPLAGAGKIALYGSGARRTLKGGTGSGDVNVRHFVTVEEGLKNAGFEITTTAWLDAYEKVVHDTKAAYYGKLREEAIAAGRTGLGIMFYCFGNACPEPDYELPLDGEGDTALYVLSRQSGEGVDRKPVRGDINLTETEIRDILALNKKYKNFILVLNVGGLIDLEPVAEVGNVLLMGQLGIETGNALADVLLGKAYPSGKLTMTWAPIADYPTTEGFGDMHDTYYKEGIYVGYRYFDTVGYEPTFPFGYGLSYTTFAVEPAGFAATPETVTVTAKVTNTGKHAGKEIVEVYVSAPEGNLEKPFQELKGFAKTPELAPGASCEVTVTVKTERLASYCPKCAAYILEKGDYRFRIGTNCRSTALAGVLSLDETATVEKLKNICAAPPAGFEELKPARNPVVCDSEADLAKAPKAALKAADIPCRTVSYSEMPAELPKGPVVQWADVVSGAKTTKDFVAGLTDDQLACLCIGEYSEGVKEGSFLGQASHSVAGAAGETTLKLADLGMPSIALADGPAGLRLSTSYILSSGTPFPTAVPFSDDSALVLTEEESAELAKMGGTPPASDDGKTYHQYCVAIPIGTALSQSWNPDVVKACGDIVGEEMTLFGTPSWLAPAMNIYRSPLCGRNFEYYSEDPMLAGAIAAAMTQGIQAHDKCGVTIKHFCCNNQETNRLLSNSVVSERALREIYLKGFELCVRDSHPLFVMSSYNLLNGTHTCMTKDVQTHALRDEWGFDGVVMTDWTVTGGLTVRSDSDKYDFANCAGNVHAGNDLTEPGAPHDKQSIMDALKDGTLTRGEVQLCALRVADMVLKLA